MSQTAETVEDIANEVENKLPTIVEDEGESILPSVEEAIKQLPSIEGEDEAESVANIEKEIIGGALSDEKMETDSPTVEMKIMEMEQTPMIVDEVPDTQCEAPSVDGTTVEEPQPPLTVSIAVCEPKKEELPKAEENEDETFDANPQVNVEDMKAAQDDLNRLDVLVCGGCHNVFHFVEDFTRHKPQCRKKSNFHGNIAETKPQVWAFLLWKNAQTKVTRRGIVEESSWKLYQKWCKMSERIRNAWIAAGEAVMNFSNFNLHKSEPKKVERNEQPEPEVEDEKPVIMRKFVQRDHLGEIKEIRPSPGIIKKRLKDDIENIRNQLEDGDSSQDKEHEQDEVMQRVGPPKVQHIKTQDGQEVTLQEEEFVVEKIVSRRFNPRKKQYEYLIKWEGYPSEQNTWEPAENMEACQHLLKAFEENLAKQSMAKGGAPRGGQAGGRKGDSSVAGPSGLNSYGRPVRYSKQKALNQVKAWCGSIKPDELELENSEDDELASKRIKLDLESDSEDSLMGGRIMYTKSGSGGIVKRGGGAATGLIRRPGRPPNSTNLSNGGTGAETLASALGLESSGDEGGDAKAKLSALALLNQKSVVNKVSSLSPANQQVLVANAKGVVKIDPSQVPNLTSGVYIMSNKSGITKLDGVSPSKAQAVFLKQGAGAGGASVTTTKSGGVVIMKSGGTGSPTAAGGQAQPTKSGIMRKAGVGPPSGGGVRGGGRGPGRPPAAANNRPSGILRAEGAGVGSNTKVIPSGSMNFSVGRPKTTIGRGGYNSIQKKGINGSEKRILGPKPSGGGRGAGRGGGGYGRGGRGGGFTRVGTASSVSDDMESVSSKGRVLDSDSLLMDFHHDSGSSESEPGLPDDFPVGELPPLEPESPPRPLTLCPLTGKVLSKAEGERTPDPTPPPSPPKPAEPPRPPKPQTKVVTDGANTTIPAASQVEGVKLELDINKIKTEPQPPSPTSAYLNKLNNGTKDVVVKKTLKPGTIGSVTVSPKKILAEAAMDPKSEDDMVTITGDDGLIYKVSSSELGNTLLVSGEDGQQCVYVTTGEDGDDSTAVLTLDPSYADAVSQLSQAGILSGEGDGEAQYFVKEGEDGELVGLQVGGGEGGAVVGGAGGEEPQAQVVAQLVEAGDPAPGGGPRRVVLLLPDGNLMVTEVDEEQYAALELDKYQGTAEIE